MLISTKILLRKHENFADHQIMDSNHVTFKCLSDLLACMAGARKGKGEGKWGARDGFLSPFPFLAPATKANSFSPLSSACHAGY